MYTKNYYFIQKTIIFLSVYIILLTNGFIKVLNVIKTYYIGKENRYGIHQRKNGRTHRLSDG